MCPMHEHPTQALLDLYTIKKKKGRIKGLRVAIRMALLYMLIGGGKDDNLD